MDQYQLAKICMQGYSEFPDLARYWDGIIPLDGGFTFIKRIEDVDCVVCRGSVSRYDWELDFRAHYVNDPKLGPVHAGFMASADIALPKLLPMLNRSRRITVLGHSKGGGAGQILAGRLLSAGYMVGALATYGAPRAGFARLASILAKIEKKTRWVNGADPVTRVPLDIGEFKYVHMCDPTILNLRLAGIEKWIDLPGDWAVENIEFHHWENYLEGIRRDVSPNIDKDLADALCIKF